LAVWLLVSDGLVHGSDTATIQIGSGEGEPSTNVTVRLEALDIPAPGLGAYVIDVSYDSNVVEPGDCEADPGGVIGSPDCNPDYATGVVRCGGFQTTAGLTGQVALCDVTFELIGETGECTDLVLGVSEFAGTDMIPIPHGVQHGEICSECEDADEDGVCDSVDQCLNTSSGEDVDANGCSDAQVDGDGDGVCDPDAPSAGPSGCTGSDNCPDDPNPDQEDTDGDGIGDACETTPITPTPQPGTPTPTPTPTGTATPTPVVGPGVPMVAGWNDRCYIGDQMAVEDALTGIEDKVIAIYILKPSQEFDRWFPGRPEVSTIENLKPYDQLFVLMSEAGIWVQEQSTQTQPSVNLVQGWNSVCYSGQTKPVEDATSGIAEAVRILYKFLDTQAWARYVPSRPDISTMSTLTQLDSVILLVTQEGGTTWEFDP